MECPKFFELLGKYLDRISDERLFECEVPAKESIVHRETALVMVIETVHLLSNVNKENPNHIEKLIEDEIIGKAIAAL